MRVRIEGDLLHVGAVVAVGGTVTWRGELPSAFPRRARAQRALQLAPVEPVLFVNLGKVYRARGDPGGAYRSLLRAWQLDKYDPAPAAELACMGVSCDEPPCSTSCRAPTWCNRTFGKLRSRLERALTPRIV